MAGAGEGLSDCHVKGFQPIHRAPTWRRQGHSNPEDLRDEFHPPGSWEEEAYKILTVVEGFWVEQMKEKYAFVAQYVICCASRETSMLATRGRVFALV